MGCLYSKDGEVRTLSDNAEEPLPASAFSTRGAAHAWLQELGLPQYAEAFDEAGFSDWDLLSCLTEADLDAITAHTSTRIPPGHRKKLLMASRQMGASSQAAFGSPPPQGSIQRYSHSSNPGNGNGSRAGGLTAAAAAVLSLECRSNGLLPNSTSRVPSFATGQPPGHTLGLGQGQGLGLGHLPNGFLGLGNCGPGSDVSLSRNVTEDGLVSGRHNRVAVGVLVPSQNNSRNSLSAAGAGHAIGYIASPAMTGAQDAAGDSGGGGGSDAWAVTVDGRRSPPERGSPTAVAAAAGAAAASGPTPPRQRRRWSANRYASRGVLIGGAAGGGGEGGENLLASASSNGWLEPEVMASVLRGAGPITDDVRQMSVMSSIGDAYGTAGGNAVPVQYSNSRDLEALVVGVGGGASGAPSSRVQALAARPDGSYGGGGGLPSTQPQQRVGGSQSGFGGGSTQVYAGALGDVPYLRSNLRQEPSAAPAVAAAPPQSPGRHVPSHVGMDGHDPYQTPAKQRRISSGRDAGAAAVAAIITPASASGGGGAGATARGGSLHASPSMRRPGSGNDANRKGSVPPALLSSQSSRPPTAAAGVAGAAGAPASTPPPTTTRACVAWAPKGDAHSSPAAPAAVLPKFMRAIAGWAIPTPGSGGDGSRRTRSANRQRRPHQRQSVPQPMRPRSRSNSAVPELGDAAEETGPAADRPVVLAAAGVAASGGAPGPAAAPPPLVRGQRSRCQLMVPDVPRGPWDQDSALCIQGRGFRPPSAAGSGTTAAAARRTAAAAGHGGSGSEAVDASEPAAAAAPPSSASHLASSEVRLDGHAFTAAAAAAAARGGGWPFVIPQLPLPPRPVQAGVAGRSPSPPPLPSMLLESLASDASAATTVRRAPPVHSSRPRDWCPSQGGGGASVSVSEALSAAVAATADLSGGNTTALKLDADGESSADELALWYGFSGGRRPHRVQIVSSAIATAAPYSGAAAQYPPHGGFIAAAAAAQWPVMPLQPPTRAKLAVAPAVPSGRGDGSGGGLTRMQILSPEFPGPSCRSAVPASPAPQSGVRGGGGDLPCPTPGRKLDLEMLADQVGRVMRHLSDITGKGEEDMDGDVALAVASPPSAAAAGLAANGRDGEALEAQASAKASAAAAAGGMSIGTAAAAAGGGGGTFSRPRSRLQAIDKKRMELELLHQDLVRKVAAMATDAPPAAGCGAASYAGASGNRGAATAATAGGETSAADALAEVEDRIRSKLAVLTTRPDPDPIGVHRTTPTATVGAAASGGGGRCSFSGTPRKRTLDSDSIEGSPVTVGALGLGEYDDDSGDGGGGMGPRRVRGETALHQEVLAVLGARKRQVRGAATSAAAATETAAHGGVRRDEWQGQLQLQLSKNTPPCPGPGVPPPGAGAGLAGGGMVVHQQRQHQQSPAAAAAARGTGGGGDAPRGAVLLAEMHDALKAELLAIDNKIKARLLGGGGGAVSRRS